MTIPERIPFARIEKYYTRNIGTFAGGKQFMAFVVAEIDMANPDRPWEERKRWYAVLHKFDENGAHIGTDHWFAGTTADGEPAVTERAARRVTEFMSALPNVQFGDIAIRLFQTVIDGHLFGLCRDEESENIVQLLPNDLVFYPPWDGSYDT